MGRPSKYAPELRDRAVRMVQEHADEYSLTLGITEDVPAMSSLVDAVNAALSSVFLAAWFIAAAGWFYAIAEGLATTGFARFAFATGLKVVEFRDTAVARPAPIIPGSVGETEHAKFKAVDEGLYFFRAKFPIFVFRPKIHTPFPLEGTIRPHDGVAHVVGRLPVGTLVFTCAWLVGSTAGGLMFLLKGGPAGLAFVLLGWGVVYGMVVVSLHVEKPRFQRAYFNGPTRR